MTPDVQALYTPEVRDAVARSVGVDPDAMRDIGGFESFVHEVVVDGTPRIVKATWGGRRSAEEMGAELHFVSFLADHGAPVCRPLQLACGELQRPVAAENGAFHVTSWVKAPGASLTKEAFTPGLFRAWGALVGRLHHLSTQYEGPPAPFRRPTWEEEHAAYASLASSEPDIRQHMRELLDRIAQLPRCAMSFGAMHTDLHRYNIHWHEGEMLVFDFEDMVDFWFVSDIAIVLFYAVMSPLEGVDRQALYDTLKEAVLAGYATEHELPEGALDHLPLFMSLREQVLRAVVLRSMPADTRPQGWTDFVDESALRIRAGQPALGLRI